MPAWDLAFTFKVLDRCAKAQVTATWTPYGPHVISNGVSGTALNTFDVSSNYVVIDGSGGNNNCVITYAAAIPAEASAGNGISNSGLAFTIDTTTTVTASHIGDHAIVVTPTVTLVSGTEDYDTFTFTVSIVEPCEIGDSQMALVVTSLTDTALLTQTRLFTANIDVSGLFAQTVVTTSPPTVCATTYAGECRNSGTGEEADALFVWDGTSTFTIDTTTSPTTDDNGSYDCTVIPTTAAPKNTKLDGTNGSDDRSLAFTVVI